MRNTILYIILGLALTCMVENADAQPEFDVESLTITANSPFFDSEGNMLFIEGYPLTVRSVIKNSGSTGTNFNTGLFTTIFGSPSLQSSEFKTVSSLASGVSYTQTLNDVLLSSNTYRMQALVNTDAIRLDANGRHTFNSSEAVITISVGSQVNEVNQFDNLKLQTLIMYSCNGIDLNVSGGYGSFTINGDAGPNVALADHNLLVGDQVDVSSQTLNSGNNLDLKGTRVVLKPGFKASEGVRFKAIAEACSGSGSARLTFPAAGSLTETTNQTDQILTYPNAFDEVIYIQSPLQISKVTITDMQGHTYPLDYIINSQSVDTSKLSAGVYVLTVHAAEKQFRIKMIKP